MLDAHAHIDYRKAHSQVSALWLNSSREEEWALLDRSDFCFFGIHPWVVEETEDGWENRLRALVSSNGRNCGIGEIGLDFACCTNRDLQLAVFTAQLDIAAEFSLTVSIHCIKAWEKLFEILEHYQDLKIMFHAYSGSPEIAEQLLNMGYSLSFSPQLWSRNGKKMDRLRDFFSSIPLSQIFLETDCSDSTGDCEDSLLRLYSITAEKRGIPVDQLMAEMEKNGQVFKNGIVFGAGESK